MDIKQINTPMQIVNNLPCAWRKDHKYYKVDLQPNLFGTISVICSWGSINNNLGNYKIVICDTQEKLESTLKSIFQTRKYRGYNISSTSS